MDWQQFVALLIVGVTAGVFVWSKARPRKFSFHRDTHCGCSAKSASRSAGIGPAPSIQFRARKGERARIIVKSH